MKQWSTPKIRALKGQEPIVCLTAYDHTTARLIDACGLHLALVGDSLATTVLGHATTLPVTMEEMLHHTRAVARGIEHALVVGDMPFMSYQASEDEAVANAGRFIKDGGADAVKVEGGRIRTALVQRLVANGIPVLGHIGLTPQSINEMGGHKIQGRAPEEAQRLLEDARALEEAGVFGLVLECVPAELAREITAAVAIPTIGIGAGPHCDGQILVIHDLLGFTEGFAPKFLKRYAELGELAREAISAYAGDVRTGTFPAPEHCY
jgi:3-methyl-2-oxobutanoate hydroxymethyltransferase